MINGKAVKQFLLTIGTLCLVGCGPLTQFRLDMADRIFGREPLNAPAALQAITPTATVNVDWTAQMGETARYDYAPALSAGYVYAANAKGELAKMHAETGRSEWRINVGEPISGGVGTGGGLVMVGTSRGHVLAYDVNGKQVWQSKLSSEVLSVPRYFEGKVVVRSGDNHIYGLDAADGKRKWVYSRQAPALSLRSSAGVVVDGGAAYAGFSGGKMVAINAENGRLLWETTVAVPRGVTEIERIADITSLPVVDGPVVYAVAYQGRVAAIDRRSGKVLWNREISSYSGLAFDGDKLYVSHALGSFYSLNYETGRTFWRQGDLLNRRLTTPLVMNGVVAVGDLEGYMHFIDQESGQFVARARTGDKAVMSVVAGETPSQLIAATRNGGLYAMTVSGLATTTPAVEVEVEQPAVEETEAVTEILEEAQEETESRSILFEKQEPLLSPDAADDNGIGVKLPPAE